MRTTLSNDMFTSFMPADEYVTQMERGQYVQWLDEQAWKCTAPVRHRYRILVAQALIALAARLAPTITAPPPEPRAMAQ